MAERTTIDDVALRRLKWRSRRGLLECDLLIARFFESNALADLTARQVEGFRALMDLDDPTLLELLLGRREPEGALDCDEVRTLLVRLRPRSADGPLPSQTSPLGGQRTK
jgi:antitoxin CptB